MANIIFASDMGLPFGMKEVWECDTQQFNELALRLFHYQSKNNKVFADYLNLIDVEPSSIDKLEDIVYLPIGLFKSHKVICKDVNSALHFESSSTGNQGVSKHYIPNLDAYHQNCKRIFEQFIGPLQSLDIYGLLPSYLEREHSSLVSMVNEFAKSSQTPEPHFYLYDHQSLAARLQEDKACVLFGVSYALLDFASEQVRDLPNLTIVETGGMKGRREEMTREALYAGIKNGFPTSKLLSEYGMTELMSQAYALEGGAYHCPPWMQVSLRPDNDPLASQMGKRGALNIIDLANIHSCAFLATDDLGFLDDDGSFEVLGRLDHADIRGCSLMIS